MQVHDDCVLILDKFPKAKHHALVIAREQGLDGPHLLRKEHLPLLQHMQVGRVSYRRLGVYASDNARTSAQVMWQCITVGPAMATIGHPDMCILHGMG